MNERYDILYGGNIIQDTILDEDYHITTNRKDLGKVIGLLNSQEKELRNHNKTQILALILGLLIGLSIGGLVI